MPQTINRPEVGMGVTEGHWGDRHAYTVIEVSASGKRAKIQRDRAIRTDDRGMSDWQDYRYERDTDGGVREISLRRDGRWRQVGQSKGSATYTLGVRNEHYNFSL